MVCGKVHPNSKDHLSWPFFVVKTPWPSVVFNPIQRLQLGQFVNSLSFLSSVAMQSVAIKDQNKPALDKVLPYNDCPPNYDSCCRCLGERFN